MTRCPSYIAVLALLFTAATALVGVSVPPFECTDGHTVDLRQVCNGAVDCPDGSDEAQTLCSLQSCPKHAFTCAYGACIKLKQKCDGRSDCADASDEDHCGHDQKSCSVTEFRCDSGECIDQRMFCDGSVDCLDHSDESTASCRDFPCPSNAFRCRYGACVPMAAKCDGQYDCVDGSDEAKAICPNAKCSDKEKCRKLQHCRLQEFQCQSGDCVDRVFLCDGRAHCDDGSDETADVCFGNVCPPTMFRCSYGACIGGNLTCDDEVQCVDWSDEDPELCKTPPLEKSCRLPARTPHTRYETLRCAKCQPGAVVAEYQELKYSCDVGHSLQGATTVYCHNSAWVPRPPTCTPAHGHMTCPPIKSNRITVTCESVYGNQKGYVPCDSPMPVGTVARYHCRQYYTPSDGSHDDNTESVCRRDGTWSKPLLRCEPECGQAGQEVTPLIVNGQEAQYGLWPWQVGLYVQQAGNWSFWCGGSLVNEYAVVTAAHCVWKITAENLRVAFGKFYRDFNKIQELTQIRDIKKIVMQPAYQDQPGNYGSDIAVLVLATPIEFTTVVRPVCIDWDLQYMNTDLAAKNVGMISGWGLNENDTFSDTLRVTQLQVVSDATCIDEQPRDFKKYVTYTTFCAGYRNGTGVCNGDSGGGLVFQSTSSNNTWMLQGLVSVSPRRRGTSFCDPTYYTVFTKVGIYLKWLESVLTEMQPTQDIKEKLDDGELPDHRFPMY